MVPDDGSVIEALRRGDETELPRLVDHSHASLGRVARLSGKADAVTQWGIGFTDDGVSGFARSITTATGDRCGIRSLNVAPPKRISS